MIAYLLGLVFEWFLEQMIGGLFTFLLAHMSSDGLMIFDLEPVKLLVQGAYKIGLLLWAFGIVAAVFDLAVQYGSGKGSPKDLLLNYVRSYLAAVLFTVLPIPAYKMLLTAGWKIGAAIAGGSGTFDVGIQNAWQGVISLNFGVMVTFIFGIIFLIVVVLNYFEFLKRSFFLFFLVIVGCLYMPSVPRGYVDGFIDWCKQVIGLCVASFLQMAGMGICLTFFVDGGPFMLVGLAGLVATSQVDRLMQRFGGASGQTNLSGIGTQAYHGINMLTHLAH